jgi:hypothetical protein
VNRAQIGTQNRYRVRAILSMQIIMKTRDRNCQHAAQHPDWIASPLLSDEGVPHLNSLAKNAVAFFRISRSILSVAFSARSRDNSLSSSLIGLRLGELSGRAAREASNQLPRVLTDICQGKCLALEVICVETTENALHEETSKLLSKYHFLASALEGQVQYEKSRMVSGFS